MPSSTQRMQPVSKTTPVKKQKTEASSTEEVDQTNEEQKALQDQLFQEIQKRKGTFISKKSKTKDGKFWRKKKSELSWKNLVHTFFNEHKGFHIVCCEKTYERRSSCQTSPNDKSALTSLPNERCYKIYITQMQDRKTAL